MGPADCSHRRGGCGRFASHALSALTHRMRQLFTSSTRRTTHRGREQLYRSLRTGTDVESNTIANSQL